ncbi:hypothetical protein AAG570_013474, partial [Ranatra chinensis]
YTQGIFQSIGFKEFHDYLTLAEEERETEAGRKLFQEGVEALKLVTRRYARKQNKWVRNRFLRSGNRQVPPVYNLDTTDVSRWDEVVLRPATAIINSMMGCEVDVPPQPLARDQAPPPQSTGQHYCHTCNRIFIGKEIHQLHYLHIPFKKLSLSWGSIWLYTVQISEFQNCFILERIQRDNLVSLLYYTNDRLYF